MDGVLSNEYRKFFILTTNETYINDNLLQRPGRIRYFKTFSNLKPHVVNEIVDDFLVHKHFRKEVIQFISTLELITIDIAKSIVEEVNIHEESPEMFKDIFNCKKISGRFNIYELTPNANDPSIFDEKKIFEAVKTNRHNLVNGDENIGYGVYIDGDNYGKIKKVINPNVFLVELYPVDEEGEVDEDNDEKKPLELKMLRVENCDVVNYTFKWGDLMGQ